MFEIKTESAAERKMLLRSLILSIIILAFGLVWAYRIGYNNLPAEHELGHASEDLEALLKAYNTHNTHTTQKPQNTSKAPAK